MNAANMNRKARRSIRTVDWALDFTTTTPVVLRLPLHVAGQSRELALTCKRSKRVYREAV
jgi:hypothetical protein